MKQKALDLPEIDPGLGRGDIEARAARDWLAGEIRRFVEGKPRLPDMKRLRDLLRLEPPWQASADSGIEPHGDLAGQEFALPLASARWVVPPHPVT